MHKDGKWARQILALQEDDGKWGCFHSLSQFYGASITTEQALRRLERLGYTMEDACIQKAVSYMDGCLRGVDSIPDRREKVQDWDVFTSMILAAWIRRFTEDNAHANRTARQWAEILSAAFSNGDYDHERYVSAYKKVLQPNGGRIISPWNFYPVSLVRDCLDRKTEERFLEHVINSPEGIYYIFDSKIAILPQAFESRIASRYIGAIELLAEYKHAKPKLGFVKDWLYDNRNENGKWDMGGTVNDKVYFPLSDDWRRRETREADCTERVTRLLARISDGEKAPLA